MFNRTVQKKLEEYLRYFPCVAIIGPRQVGKTTLAKTLSRKHGIKSIYLDLELTADYHKLTDAETYLTPLADKNIIIDEVQRNKSLFPLLRGLIDQKRRPGRFILLGSAAPDLIRDSSESLAGRIGYIELCPLTILEVRKKISLETLWLKGGFPGALTGKIPTALWMENFIRTYFEQDLPQLGFPAGRVVSRKLWSMLAHNHGGVLNYSDLSKSMELSANTVKGYLNFLENVFLIRQLQPYHVNMKKRLVKAPKIYLRDSGILHHFLNINGIAELRGHLKMGASWEGFVIEQIAALLSESSRMFFYRTHDGSELDLVIEKGGKPYAGIEIKYGSDIKPSKGNIEAIKTLKTRLNFIVVKEREEYETGSAFKVVGLERFLEKYIPMFNKQTA